jgi:hypothetical protein
MMGTRLQAGDRGLIPGRGQDSFSLPQWPDQLWDPPNLLPNGYWELFPLEEKQTGHEDDHSSPCNAKNAWFYSSTPPIHLHDMVLS